MLYTNTSKQNLINSFIVIIHLEVLNVCLFLFTIEQSFINVTLFYLLILIQ